MDAERAQWQAWCAERTRSVTAVPGNLALIGYQGVGEAEDAVDHLPGVTVRREPGAAGVLLSAPATAGVEVDGIPVDGETFVGRLRPDGTPLIHAGGIWADVFSLDGSDYELRCYDEAAPNLDNFAGITRYDYDPALAVPGEFRAYAERDAVAWEFTRAADTGHTKQVPGTITLDLAGTRHELLGFLDGAHLVLVFADGTTGAESYAPGRFLRMPSPSPDAPLVVDFNRAFIPPCGFSDFYSCPIPPAQNRLPVPIRAGEQRVEWKRPRY